MAATGPSGKAEERDNGTQPVAFFTSGDGSPDV